jgi:hypothetical protein
LAPNHLDLAPDTPSLPPHPRRLILDASCLETRSRVLIASLSGAGWVLILYPKLTTPPYRCTHIWTRIDPYDTRIYLSYTHSTHTDGHTDLPHIPLLHTHPTHMYQRVAHTCRTHKPLPHTPRHKPRLPPSPVLSHIAHTFEYTQTSTTHTQYTHSPPSHTPPHMPRLPHYPLSLTCRTPRDSSTRTPALTRPHHTACAHALCMHTCMHVCMHACMHVRT